MDQPTVLLNIPKPEGCQRCEAISKLEFEFWRLALVLHRRPAPTWGWLPKVVSYLLDRLQIGGNCALLFNSNIIFGYYHNKSGKKSMFKYI